MSKPPATAAKQGAISPNVTQCGTHCAQQREQRHGGKGLEREDPAHALERQAVERQVDQEEDQAEVPAGGVVQQKGQPCGATRQQPGVAEHHHAQRDEQRAGEQGLHVLVRPVPWRRWHLGQRPGRAAGVGGSGCSAAAQTDQGGEHGECRTSRGTAAQYRLSPRPAA
jgi:hypothetical protein